MPLQLEYSNGNTSWTVSTGCARRARHRAHNELGGQRLPVVAPTIRELAAAKRPRRLSRSSAAIHALRKTHKRSRPFSSEVLFMSLCSKQFQTQGPKSALLSTVFTLRSVVPCRRARQHRDGWKTLVLSVADGPPPSCWLSILSILSITGGGCHNLRVAAATFCRKKVHICSCRHRFASAGVHFATSTSLLQL